jgi:hypothetical protein
MSTAQAMVRNLARRNPILKNVLVAVHDTLIDRSVPVSYKIMRGICRFDFLRRTVLALKRERIDCGSPSSEIIHGGGKAQISAALQRDGLALGLEIDDSVLSAIRSHCETALAVTDNGERVIIPEGLEHPPIPDCVFYRYKDLHQQVPAVAALANDPLLVAIVTEYLGMKPVLLGSRAWWSYPPPPSSAAARQPHLFGFHYDIDDYKFIKLFIYLTDVDLASGPHVAISGTHRSKSLFEKVNRRISDEVANDRYKESIRVITGRAGTAFLEDTFCYHKGMSPQKRRLIMELEFGTQRFH